MADGPDSHDRPVRSEKKVYNHVEDTPLLALLDGMDSGVAIYEPVDGGQDFVFRAFNGAAQRIDNISREQVIGLFQIANRDTDYTEDDVRALRSIADHIAPVLRARLQRDQQERERRSMEEALRASGAKLRGILDATRESIWMFAPEGVVLLANSTAIARIGKPAQEIIGRHLNDLIPPELARTRLERIREVVLTARPVEFEDVRAGMHFHHSFYPVLDGAGAVASVVSFSRDITECNRAEREIRRQNEVLEPCIRERPWLGKDQIMNYSSALSIGEKLMEVKYEH